MDITERKRVEQALRSSEMRLTLAQEAAGIGVWDWNLLDNAMQWSPEIFALLEIEADPAGAPRLAMWFRALHRDDRRRASETIRRAAMEAQPFSIDFRLRPREGNAPRWIRSRGAPVLGEDGRPTRYAG